MFKLFAIALFALLAAVAVMADEFHKPNVVNLTSKNYEEKVNDGSLYFVKMYAPWCGHCKRLAEAWGQLGDEFKDDPKVHIAHVDCTQEKAICDKFEVRGYPTLKAIVNGAEFKPYKGARDLDTLKSWTADTKKEALSETTG